MRFLRKTKAKKVVLVISDLHLSAGVNYKGRRNYLEDFLFDKELVEFLEYYSKDQYSNKEVELIINGDFIDFLAVPFINYFDDDFWSEEAAIEKLKIIMNAHTEVIDALNKFLETKNKKIIYIIGNHDAEFAIDSVRDAFEGFLTNKAKKNFSFYLEGEYRPVEGIVIKHGHEYEIAHQFDLEKSVVKSSDGRKFFVPPWGSYYVIRVVNKFKEERSYVNQVKPIKTFLTYGLIFDTLFTLRFIFANVYYFIMVRFLDFYQSNKKLKHILKKAVSELELFQKYEDLTRTFFNENDAKALIVGHTHEPNYHTYGDGTIFVNTGTWTRNVNLDFAGNQNPVNLTFAQVDVFEPKKNQQEKYEHLDVALNVWRGSRDLPYKEFS